MRGLHTWTSADSGRERPGTRRIAEDLARALVRLSTILSSFPGVVVLILLFPIVLTYPLSRLLPRAYRSEVEMISRCHRRLGALVASARRFESAFERRGGSAKPHTLSRKLARAAAAETLRYAPLRSAAWQGGRRGRESRSSLAMLLLAAGGLSLNPVRVPSIATTLFWPGVLTILLIRRHRAPAVMAHPGRRGSGIHPGHRPVHPRHPRLVVAPYGRCDAVAWASTCPSTIILGMFLQPCSISRTVGPMVFLVVFTN